MFNFFNKKKEKEENLTESKKETARKDIKASITYFIRKDGTPFVDANVKDLDEESVTLLGQLIVGLGNNSYLESTIEMVRDYLLETDNLDLYLKMATRVTATMHNGKEEKGEEEEPCIKPSDAI